MIKSNNETLTPEQLSAVKTTEGLIRVVAGAGSGKTRTLVHRYAHLLNWLGVPQSDILCMTFTNKAAQEMKARIAALCPGGVVGDFVTTIHGFCVKFLREEIYRLGYPQSFTIVDEEDMRAIIKDVLEENGVERKSGTVGKYMDELAAFKATTPYIQRFILPSVRVPEADVTLLCKIILRQKRSFALDFDDLLFFALHLLNNFPEVRQKWQQQFQYVMVDEVQDCSRTEWELFTILSEHYGNLFIVGDGDQAIYEWRGAHPELFVEYVPQKDIYLRQNFRSRPNIVCLADSIIANNKRRLPRTSVTMRASDGFRTKFFHCRNEQEEAERTASELKAYHERERLEWKDMAVLFRASYLSRAIEQVLIREKIPYVIWGGVRFFERKEIKDALSYLRLVVLDDDLAFKRIANVPSRKLGKKTLSKLEGYANAKRCSLFQALAESDIAKKNSAVNGFIKIIADAKRQVKKVSISALMEFLLEKTGLLEMYRTDTDEERLENLQELIKSIQLYEEENVNEEDAGVERYLQDIALYTNADYRKDNDKVKLMTIHQAKGLEFPLVWIYGLTEGVFPSHRTIRERGEAGLEEERRLMYVACTRAKDRLFFSDSEGYNAQNSMSKYPSRFIREARDCNGPLYDIVGAFDPELWNGTDGLIMGTKEGLGNGESRAVIQEGDSVHHPVFGEGTVMSVDADASAVIVMFTAFGKRRINAEQLEKD